jgi:hypothetical protein
MGFGVLFIGYLFTYLFAMTPFSYPAEIIGNAVILYAVILLSRHNKFLKFTVYAESAVLFCAVVNVILYYVQQSAVSAVMEYVKIISVFLFHFMLYKGISMLAKDTELPKIVRKAKRNTYITVTYLMFSLFLQLPFPEKITNELRLFLTFPVFFLGLIWLALNCTLFYSCYMWICLEGDEDMEAKESRFEAVNKISNKLSSVEDKAFGKTEKPGAAPPETKIPETQKKHKKKK